MTEYTILATLFALSLASGCGPGDAPRESPRASAKASEAAAKAERDDAPKGPDPAHAGRPELRPIPATAWAEYGLVGKVKRLETQRIRDGAEPEIGIIEFTPFGHKARVYDSDTDWFTAELDDRGRVKGASNEFGRFEVLEFDAQDRRRVWRDVFRPTRPHRSETSETTSLELDAEGRISRRTVVHADPPGPETTVVTEFTYDDDGDWKTKTEYGTTRERKVMEYDGPNKRVVSRLEGGMLTEVIHRPSGRVLSELGAGRSVERKYESIDDRGNWLTLVVNSASFGDPYKVRVTRTIEYYPDAAVDAAP